MYKEVFSIRIKAIREELGLSQIQVSKETGINQSKISKYENSQLEPDLETLGKLAFFYGISVDWLLGIPNGKNKGDCQ